jgi:hypothetical protein
MEVLQTRTMAGLMKVAGVVFFVTHNACQPLQGKVVASMECGIQFFITAMSSSTWNSTWKVCKHLGHFVPLVRVCFGNK